MNTPSDQDIINRFSEGIHKEKAFSQLVEKYQEALYWSVRRVVKNHENTDDIVQNTWVKVWNNLHKFKGESAIYTWIYRIARNETYTFLNSAYNRNYFPTDEIIVEGNSQNGLGAEEIEKLLFEAVELLPEKQQIIFQMKYFDEMKFKEISEILQTSEGGLKASYHHAVKKVESFLKNRLNL